MAIMLGIKFRFNFPKTDVSPNLCMHSAFA